MPSNKPQGLSSKAAGSSIAISPSMHIDSLALGGLKNVTSNLQLYVRSTARFYAMDTLPCRRQDFTFASGAQSNARKPSTSRLSDSAPAFNNVSAASPWPSEIALAGSEHRSASAKRSSYHGARLFGRQSRLRPAGSCSPAAR